MYNGNVNAAMNQIPNKNSRKQKKRARQALQSAMATRPFEEQLAFALRVSQEEQLERREKEVRKLPAAHQHFVWRFGCEFTEDMSSLFLRVFVGYEALVASTAHQRLYYVRNGLGAVFFGVHV